MRDSQRQKVYGAEALWKAPLDNQVDATLLGIDSQIVNFVIAREILDKAEVQFQTSGVRLKRNRKLRQWGGWYRYTNSTIEVPDETASVKTILHEFAHHLDGYRKDILDDRWQFRSHGGSFTEAMVDIVWWFYGTESAKELISTYRFKKAIIGADEETVRFTKLNDDRKAADARGRDLHGKEGTVYVVKLHYPATMTTRYVADASSGWWDYTTNRTYAKAWRRRSTAEKWAKRWGSKPCQATVEETDGHYNKYDKGWMAST